MTMNWPGSSGGDDAHDYDQPHRYGSSEREGGYGGGSRGYGGQGSGRESRGGAFDEFRRQMEEMLGGTRPTGPIVRTERRRSSEAPQPHDVDHMQTGIALAAAVSFWALPFALRGRRKGRRLRRRRPGGQQGRST